MKSFRKCNEICIGKQNPNKDSWDTNSTPQSFSNRPFKPPCQLTNPGLRTREARSVQLQDACST